MRCGYILVGAALTATFAARAAPVTTNGVPVSVVATGPGTTQLFGLTSDAQGRVYVGNNSNDPSGIPVQRYDPALYSGTPIALQNFGPPVGDADGITYSNGSIYVTDRDDGVRRIPVGGGADTLFLPGRGINADGSPLAVRPSDGHLFVGFGGGTGVNIINEFDAAGAFVRAHATGTEIETMTFDPRSGLIYYAPFGSAVRALDPVTDVDRLVGQSSGVVDGGLAFDALSGLLFVGTANGANSGLIETIDPATGTTKLFASGFNGSLGILREPVSGDLFFLETNQLYRLESSNVPEPGAAALACAMAAVVATRRRRGGR